MEYQLPFRWVVEEYRVCASLKWSQENVRETWATMEVQWDTEQDIIGQGGIRIIGTIRPTSVYFILQLWMSPEQVQLTRWWESQHGCQHISCSRIGRLVD